MSFVKGLKCRECGREYPVKLLAGCEQCFGPLEADYYYEEIAKVLKRDVLASRPKSMWKYRELLPLESEPKIGLGTGGTPLLRADRLGSKLGIDNLYLKNDAVNAPTLSFKDRVTGVAINKALEDPDPFVRGEALTLMMSLGNTREDTRRLGDLALNTNADPAVRINAILTLAEHPGDEPDFLLKRAIASEDPVVKDVATRVLEQREQAKKKK